MSDGTYSDCTITVTDATGNVSNTLEITSFTVDTSPVVSVVVGNNYNDSATILTSSDNGTTWTSRTYSEDKQLLGVTYGNGIFVVVGATGTIITSSDGFTWTKRTSGYSNALKGVTYANGTFLIVGEECKYSLPQMECPGKIELLVYQAL